MEAALAIASLPGGFRCFPCAKPEGPVTASAVGSPFRLSLRVAHHLRKVVLRNPIVGRGGGVILVSASAENTNGRVAEEKDEKEYVPAADFYKVEAVLRPWRLKHVASALIASGIRGVTVTDVRGFGSQLGSKERHAGSEFSEGSLVVKVKLEVVVSKDQVEAVVDTVIDAARTGEIGDGKIFISPVTDVIRVRTGERGLKAERMAGGRAELLAKKPDKTGS